MTNGTGSAHGRAGVGRVVLTGLLVLAALLRLPDLATRGTWDADQGHDMLVLRAFVREGLVPLLGPRRPSATSITAPGTTTCSVRRPS